MLALACPRAKARPCQTTFHAMIYEVFMKLPEISEYIAGWPLLGICSAPPWTVAQDCESRILALLDTLGAGYRRHGNCAVHETAIIEQGAVLKGAIAATYARAASGTD